jgi:uncharacterized surface protein with fasciclin (FAS1) repeats
VTSCDQVESSVCSAYGQNDTTDCCLKDCIDFMYTLITCEKNLGECTATACLAKNETEPPGEGANETPAPNAEVSSGTVWTVLEENNDVALFRQQLKNVNLDKILADDRVNFTVFAPPNSAVSEDAGLILYFDNDAEWSGHSTNLLENHLVADQTLVSTILFGSEAVTASSLAGEVLVIDATAQTINGQTVTSPDLLATNGVVHVLGGFFQTEWFTKSIIDVLSEGVVLESSRRLRRRLQEAGVQFSSLLGHLETTGLASDEALVGLTANGTTLVAPTDDAFAAVDGAVDEEGLSEVLLYHMVESNVYKKILDNGSQQLVSTRHPTAQMWITVRDGIMSYNNIAVRQESLANNG